MQEYSLSLDPRPTRIEEGASSWLSGEVSSFEPRSACPTECEFETDVGATHEEDGDQTGRAVDGSRHDTDPVADDLREFRRVTGLKVENWRARGR
jgi:hypothetical protein